MRLHDIELESDAVRAFCERWRVRELAVFGSIKRDDFRPDSDVDLLFALEDGVRLDFGTWVAMEDDIGSILGCRVDLAPRRCVEQSDNYIRRRAILSTAVPLRVTR